MVKITKNTNIFDLMLDKNVTIEDYHKLHEIAPEKFLGMTPEKFLALESKKNNTGVAKEVAKNDSKKADELLSLMTFKTSPSDITNAIQDIDFRKVKKEIIQEILNNIFEKYKYGLAFFINLFALIDNRKGGIDINMEINNEPILFAFVNIKNDDNKSLIRVENIIEKYKPDLKIKNRKKFTLLVDCIIRNSHKYAKILLKNGADVNERIEGYTGYLQLIYHAYLVHQLYNQAGFIQFCIIFLQHKINVDQEISSDHDTLLTVSLRLNIKLLFDICMIYGANVNHIRTAFILGTNIEYKATPLLDSNTFGDNNLYYFTTLIERGANVNYIFPTMRINNIDYKDISLLQIFIIQIAKLNMIKKLLDSGADKNHKETTTNKTALDIAKEIHKDHNKYYKDLVKLLGGELTPELWKGFSRSDIEKFDFFFEKPYDWSCCPICLEYVERSDGCMYMSHDCAQTGHYYHEYLYNLYVHKYFGVDKIEWCTICGRVTQLHKHFKLVDAKNSSKTMATLKPEIQAQLEAGDNLAFFNNANCIGFGGGGMEEKATRFRRLREYALELQQDVGKKNHEKVMDKLIEEVWNAPLVMNDKIKTILDNKKWNINAKEFPENKKNTQRNNNNSNAPNIPFNGRKPTIIEKGDCIIIGAEDEGEPSNPTYQFHHEDVGGQDHKGIYICKEDLANMLEIECKTRFGLPEFGNCWYNLCKAPLHPEEVKDIIPEILYNEYKEKFNKKKKVKRGGRRTTKKQRGGNVESVLHELKDGLCSLPEKLRKNGKQKK